MAEAVATADKARRLRPEFSVANLRMPMWSPAEAEHIKDGLHKAGLT
jgi:hypothetical protein